MSDQVEAAEPEYSDDENDSVRLGWCIESLEDADWCLKRMADLKAEMAENEAIVEQHVARLKLRLDVLNSRAATGLRFFEGRLRQYAETHRAELLKGGKKKSRALPHGTLGWRKTGGGLQVKDTEALLTWAKFQPEELGLVRVKEEPALTAIKKHAESTGEIPPGMDLAEESEEFTAKPTGVGDGNGKH